MKSSLNDSTARSHPATGASVTKERSVRIDAAPPTFTLLDLRNCPSAPSRAPMAQLIRDSLPPINAIRDLRAIMRNFYAE